MAKAAAAIRDGGSRPKAGIRSVDAKAAKGRKVRKVKTKGGENAKGKKGKQ
jgi:hypothetical protein